MCDFGVISGPTIAMTISAVAAAASASMSIVGQQQQRKSMQQYQDLQVKANEAQMRENRALATKAYLDQAVAANEGLAQSAQATAAANFDARVKRLQAEGSAKAAAAEGGVEGLSLQSILADFHRQEDMMLTRNEQNLLFKKQQTANEIEGFGNQAAGRIAQVKPYIPGPVAPVDYAGPILGVVNTGVGTYLRIKSPKTFFEDDQK